MYSEVYAIAQEHQPIKGETTLYGTVVHVDSAVEGDSIVQVRTIEGSLLHCTINQSDAKIVAQRLHEQIGLIGIAEWDVKTYEVTAFTVTEVSDYEKNPLSEAVESISQGYGQYFDAIK